MNLTTQKLLKRIMLPGLILFLAAVFILTERYAGADEGGLIQDETYTDVSDPDTIYPDEESDTISSDDGDAWDSIFTEENMGMQTESMPPEEKMDMETDSTEAILASMPIEDKVAQMFVVTPEALTGYDHVTAAEEATRAAIDRLPVGGLIYLGANLENAEQISRMLANTLRYSMERTGLPMLLCIDEEGGSVRRISGRGIAGVPDIPSMRSVGETGDVETARLYGEQMGRYLSALGFNVDFAPVADTLTDEGNQVVADRSFGWDPQRNAAMCVAVMQGLHEYGVASTFKHFPGHGSTSADSHAGYAVSYQTMDDLLACDLIPFQAGADNGTELIMTGHISLPNVTGDDTPATLSRLIVTGILREQMGYEGLIITDALEMGAITQGCSSAEAAVRAVEAGNDLILEPADLSQVYQGLLDAVGSGRISEERIDESVRRIIRFKQSMMS